MKSLEQYMNKSLVTESGVPGIKSKDDLLNLIQSKQEQCGFELEETEGDYCKIRYALHYKAGLIYWLEFPDSNYEYLDGFIAPDGSKITNNVSSDIDRTDWNAVLNIRGWVQFLMKNCTKLIAKEKARAERYRKIYDRNGSGAMYDEYTRAQSRKARWERRLEMYQNMQKYV